MKPQAPAEPPRPPAGRFSFLRLTGPQIEDYGRGLEDLDRAVGGRPADAALRRWLYADPRREGSCCIVALRGGEVVGRIGLTAIPFRCGDEEVTGGLVGRLAVREDARSWASFRGLMAASRDATRDAGMALAYGFQVARAARPTQALGGHTICPVPMLGAFLSVPRLLAGRGLAAPLAALGGLAQPLVGPGVLPRPPAGVSVGPLTGFADLPWPGATAGRAVSAVRGRAFLKWRYSGCPSRRYRTLGAWRGGELAGLAVYRAVPEGAKAYLLELMAREPDGRLLDCLAGEALRRAREEGCGLVSASFPSGTPQHRALRRAGFAAWPTHLWRIGLSVAPFRKDLRGLLLQPGRWHFSLGDWLSF